VAKERSASRHLRSNDRVGAPTGIIRYVVDPHALDVLVALVLTAAALAIVVGRSGDGDRFHGDDLTGTTLVLLQTLPLAVRRLAPLGVLTVISAAVVAHSALGYQAVQAGTFGSLVALYGAASSTDSRRGAVAGGLAAIAVAAFFVSNRGDWGLPSAAATGGTWAVAWLAGTVVRLGGEQAEVAGARAVRLELERDARAREAVADERARVARELHDIVGHALNVIVIQAAGARRVFDARPDVPREALASIEAAGREALVDMERMLGVLRAVDAHAGVPGPQPGLAQLEGLAAHVSDAGIPVAVEVEGDPAAVPASVELSAYRIVQEALTNCLKHSGASRAAVTVRRRPDYLEVEVVDDGRGPSARRGGVDGGRGHLGMRERVALFGGEIGIGPASAAGGYRVRARLPFRSTPA
jgi:signal transduction histidine kinase